MAIKKLKPEDYGLGRIQSTDERDKNFRMSAILAPEPPPERSSRTWNASGWWGNQGTTPHCVGYGWTHWLEDGPVTHKGQAPIVNPDELYHKAQLVDEWPGEDYDGTSVRAAAKVLQELGLIESYYWTWDERELAKAILTKGPVVVGTKWYTSMFRPDSNGRVKIGGNDEGGHCYVLNAYNDKTGWYRGKNSWGRDWAKSGFFYLHRDTVERLVHEDGEVCIAIEKKS